MCIDFKSLLIGIHARYCEIKPMTPFNLFKHFTFLNVSSNELLSVKNALLYTFRPKVFTNLKRWAAGRAVEGRIIIVMAH